MDKKDIVKKRYSEIANSGCSCCDCTQSSSQEASLKLGYTTKDLNSIPTESNLGLGCGTPLSVAQIKEGETILDLGSGAGLDCFLAAKETGGFGRVIGVDMTPEMIAKANDNLAKTIFNTIEFRLGEIENLPVEDNSVDVVISNCVINLCEDKQKVYNEIYRVLKSSGRVAISDIALLKALPDSILNNSDNLCNCISGAIPVEQIKEILAIAGFVNIYVEPKEESKNFIKDWIDSKNIEDYIISVHIKAAKTIN